MIKRLSYILLFISLLFITLNCGGETDPGAAVNRLLQKNGITELQIDSISVVLDKFPDGTQFSIAFIDDSSASFYGALRENDTLRIIDNFNSVFEIGSISKVFTSALLADLVHRQKLRLDDPIQDYLDFTLNDSAHITFRQLANHTSGLSRIPSGFIWESLFHMDNPYKNYSEEKLRSYMISEMKLNSEPGTEYQYSNTGAGMLGYVLTRVEGRSYDELLQETVFQPLGMASSTTRREKIKDRLVTGLGINGNPVSNWDLSALAGAGAVLSTTGNLSKFAIANFDQKNEALNLQRKTTFTVDDELDLALGWHILERDSGERWHWHNGGTGGYRSSMALNIDRKKGVIILSNVSPGHSRSKEIDKLAFILLESLKAEESEVPAEI